MKISDLTLQIDIDYWYREDDPETLPLTQFNGQTFRVSIPSGSFCVIVVSNRFKVLSNYVATHLRAALLSSFESTREKANLELNTYAHFKEFIQNFPVDQIISLNKKSFQLAELYED